MIEDDSPPRGEDIYGDLESFVITKDVPLDYESDCSCDSSHTSIPSDTWMDESDLQMLSPEKDIPAATSSVDGVLCDEKLKKAEMDLYVELVAEDLANRKSKLMHDPEYKELHDELMKMKTLLSEKEAEVSVLTNQNVNLKKNICSLYKTAKAEIEQKDEWLAEANEKVHRYHSKKYGQIDFTNQSTQTNLMDSATRTSNYPTNNENYPENSREIREKRKHSPMPQESISTENGQASKKRKHGECSLIEREKTVTKDSSLEIIKESESVNLDRKFNLLPEEVKSSFKEHEQSYFSSLNKLKQSLINSYLNPSKDQTHDGSVSLSTDPSFESPINAKSSETNILPSNNKNSCVSKDTPLPSERINDKNSKDERPQYSESDILPTHDKNLCVSTLGPSERINLSSNDKNSKDERAKTYKENHSSPENERPPLFRNPRTKRTGFAHENDHHRAYHSDRTSYPSTSSSSKRHEMHKYGSRHHYRSREPSISRTSYSSYLDRRKKLYGYSRNRSFRPPCSPVGKNTAASLTLYKRRMEKDLKRKLSLSQKKSDETD